MFAPAGYQTYNHPATSQTSNHLATQKGILFCSPSPKQILVSPKLKEFAENNFNFDENGRQLSKWVEKTVGNGEIAHCEQFLLLPQLFPHDLYCRHVKSRAFLRKSKGIEGPKVCASNFFLDWL